MRGGFWLMSQTPERGGWLRKSPQQTSTILRPAYQNLATTVLSEVGRDP